MGTSISLGQTLKKFLQLAGYGVAESLVRRFGQDGGAALGQSTGPELAGPLWDNHRKQGRGSGNFGAIWPN